MPNWGGIGAQILTAGKTFALLAPAVIRRDGSGLPHVRHGVCPANLPQTKIVNTCSIHFPKLNVASSILAARSIKSIT
jgi:hypothetical protein